MPETVLVRTWNTDQSDDVLHPFNMTAGTFIFRGMVYKSIIHCLEATRALDYTNHVVLTNLHYANEVENYSVGFPHRVDWEYIQESVMKEIVRARTFQLDQVRSRLVKSGDKIFKFAGMRNLLWDYTGKSKLTEVYDEIRTELISRPPVTPITNS